MYPSFSNKTKKKKNIANSAGWGGIFFLKNKKKEKFSILANTFCIFSVAHFLGRLVFFDKSLVLSCH